MSAPDPAGLELVEAEAIADAFGADAVRLGGAVCALRADLDEASINRVVGLGVTEPATAAVLDRIQSVFGPVRHSIALAPSAQPAALPEMLRERGYDAGYAWVKFQRPAALPFTAATGLRVERIDSEQCGEYVSVLAAGFGIPADVAGMMAHLPGRPGWGCYVAYAGEDPVAAGAVFVHGAHAWLGQATTLPEHRRQGGQSALIAARIAEARDAGATVVVTETGETVDGRPEHSYRNILRAGFEPAYLRPNYVSAPADAIA